MDAFICTACGTQYAPSSGPPPRCVICEDERQYREDLTTAYWNDLYGWFNNAGNEYVTHYLRHFDLSGFDAKAPPPKTQAFWDIVPPRGQTWTTLAALAAGHFNSYRQYEPGLIGIGTQPSFAIGQRALIVCTPHGNVLWDCISMLDPATITLINGLGGLKAIAISHPHFYTTMVEWSRAFGGAPIHLHADDERWIMHPDAAIQLWNGETLQLLPDLTLVRCGGHFAGGTVLHWAKGAGGRGVLCSSDIATVATDRKFLTFMRSYPNLIPLSAKEVSAIAAALAPFQFNAVYGHYFDRDIPTGGKQVLQASVERYIAALKTAALSR